MKTPLVSAAIFALTLGSASAGAGCGGYHGDAETADLDLKTTAQVAEKGRAEERSEDPSKVQTATAPSKADKAED